MKWEPMDDVARFILCANKPSLAGPGKRGGWTVYLPGLVPTQVDFSQLNRHDQAISPGRVAQFWFQLLDNLFETRRQLGVLREDFEASTQRQQARIAELEAELAKARGTAS